VTHHTIDTYVFTHQAHEVSGETPLGQFSRFVSDLPAQDSAATAKWTVAGYLDSQGRAFLYVVVEATVTAICQRCFQEMALPISSESQLAVVQTEQELEQDVDINLSPDEWQEPVLASQHFDVLSIVEDELILGFPYVPKHEQCENPYADVGDPEADEQEDEASPFDVLRHLKKD